MALLVNAQKQGALQAVPPALAAIEYDCTIALLALYDGPVAIGSRGAVQNPNSTFSWIADNTKKGISASGRSAVTFHASPSWSQMNWTKDDATLAENLSQAARDYLGDGACKMAMCEIKKWRYATPKSMWPERCYVVSSADNGGASRNIPRESDDGTTKLTASGRQGIVVLAGDAFGEARVEGAALSGMAAAQRVIAALGGASPSATL
jgi:predicted NAD/FAD-dependent oxidoreductase